VVLFDFAPALSPQEVEEKIIFLGICTGPYFQTKKNLKNFLAEFGTWYYL
jgi:hypothetical protein